MKVLSYRIGNIFTSEAIYFEILNENNQELTTLNIAKSQANFLKDSLQNNKNKDLIEFLSDHYRDFQEKQNMTNEEAINDICELLESDELCYDNNLTVF